MPKALKEEIGEEINAAAVALGLGENFVDKIADETIGQEEEAIAEWLAAQEHPAMAMEEMF